MDGRRTRGGAAALALALLIAIGLKAHYSTAPVDRLGWVMGPTAGLVQLCTGLPFERETGAGYVNHEYRVVIAKPCAGVNFLIMAFCMLAFTMIGRAGAGRRPFLMVAAALAMAFAATVIVNGVRIVIALRHADDGVGNGWLTPEQVHRLEGILVYFAALTGLYQAAEKVSGNVIASAVKQSDDTKRLVSVGLPCRFALRNDIIQIRWSLILVPLGWYVAMTLGVPLLNGAMRNDATQFGEHALWVLGVPLVLSGFLLLASLGSVKE